MRAMELKLTGIALNRPKNHIGGKKNVFSSTSRAPPPLVVSIVGSPSLILRDPGANTGEEEKVKKLWAEKIMVNYG